MLNIFKMYLTASYKNYLKVTYNTTLEDVFSSGNPFAIDYVKERFVTYHSCDRKVIYERLVDSVNSGLAIYMSGRSVVNGVVKETSKFKELCDGVREYYIGGLK